ncbi:Uma2 family endonuclease [Nonomuraea insulae]|uniref:Uma2 family endonuclease n=1 Tax=Nonomuraea insulae TaxID=1616787 RepID=A0ABW1D5M1_9ACTN
MATIEPIRHAPADELSEPFSVDDLLEIPDDGFRYELFHGSVVVSPAPTPLHQDVIFALQMILHVAKPAHLKVFSTVNVRASDNDFYIPDLVVVPRVAARSVKLMFRPSDVLLAVEVVSPSTKATDRRLKSEAYAVAGIPGYWRIEPDQGPTLYVYELDGDAYGEPTAYKAGTTATLSAPYPVSFDPAELIDVD